MTITLPPDTPSRNRPAAFSAEMDDYLAWLTAAIPQINAIATGSVDTGVYNAITINTSLGLPGSTSFNASAATFGVPLRALLGSTSSVAYGFNGDPNSGIYSPGANQVAVVTDGVDRILVGATGVVTVSGDFSAANVLSGTYTPTLTNVTNVAASTAYVCQYMRVGDVVTVSGSVDIDPTTAAIDTELGISLPIASALSLNLQLAGTGGFDTAGAWGEMALVTGDATNDRAKLLCRPTSNTNRNCKFHFTYRII